MTDDSGKRRVAGRSPSFPAISLPDAIEQARKLYEAHKIHPVSLPIAAKAWGVKETSSSVLAITAALKAFGLITDAGSGPSRTVKISEDARKLLTSPPAEVRRRLLAELFLEPAIVAEFWKVWGSEPPARDSAVWSLQHERRFTEDAAHRFHGVYCKSVEFLREEGALPERGGSEIARPGDHDTGPDDAPISRDTAASRDRAVEGQRTSLAWHERIVDESGVEIDVRFSKEPALGTFEYLRDYLTFKIKRMTTGAAAPASSARRDDVT